MNAAISVPAVARKVHEMYRCGNDSEVMPADNLRNLAMKYLPIVKGEVSRFKMRLPNHIEAEELHGVAIAGMMKAIERGTGMDKEKFGAYVRQRVRGAILDELRRMDVYSRSVRKKAREYDRVVQEIEQREGRIATGDDIRNEMGLSKPAFNKLLDELRPISFLSFDDPINEHREQLPISERIEDPNEQSTIEKVETKEALEMLRERLEGLPEPQKKILHMYYFGDFRLAEIAKVFDLSESRICQLHTQAIRGLRIELKKHMEH